MSCHRLVLIRNKNNFTIKEVTLYNDSCKQKGIPCAAGAGANVQPMPTPRALSAHQKFATAMAVAKDLAILASEVTSHESRSMSIVQAPALHKMMGTYTGFYSKAVGLNEKNLLEQSVSVVHDDKLEQQLTQVTQSKQKCQRRLPNYKSKRGADL